MIDDTTTVIDQWDIADKTPSVHMHVNLHSQLQSVDLASNIYVQFGPK